MPLNHRRAPVAATLLAGLSSSVVAAAGITGSVAGVDGQVYAHARVCIDRNADARCGAGEPAAASGPDGRFALKGRGRLVAEIGPGAWLVDPATGRRAAVARRLVLRAPDVGGGNPRTVGPLSTELQSMMDGGVSLADASGELAARLGLQALDPRLADAVDPADPARRAPVAAEQASLMDRLASAVAQAEGRGDLVAALGDRLDLGRIRNVVVIYAENRSFNNVFARFPGARGLRAGAAFAPQKDRDGSVLARLPPAWGGLTAAGQPVSVTQAQTTNVLPNAPFAIDAPAPAWGGPALTNAVVTRDLYHRFFENQMQIAGGANDGFAAWADAGGLVMGHFDGARTALWALASRYTLADNFFQGAFGGSFLNHQYLVCACAPDYPDADTAPAHPSIAVLQKDAAGRDLPRLALAPNSPPSALAGPPVFALSGDIAPKGYFGDGGFHAVNTMQPPYQPSANAPSADDAGRRYASPLAPTTLPAQRTTTIGDLLDGKGVRWAWYSGGWNDTLADRTRSYDERRGAFQPHHQPFNYYAAFDPATGAAARAEHLKDEADLVAAATDGTLPAVAFYKPIGSYNEHPGYASLARGDAHIAELVARLQASPQWAHMLIVVTYDENGGQWDEAAPPKGDALGPGTRVPAVIVSPFARRGHVDHTPYDTGSVLRFISHRFSLPALDGLRRRDAALAAHGEPPMGDLTDALGFRAEVAAR